MGRRILNRKDLRADFDAAERRKDEEETDEEEEEGDEEEGDEEEESTGEEEEGGAAPSEDEEGEEEVVPVKKKKVKAPAKPKRTRTAKVVRMRVIWGVFDNSNRCVATYEYPRKPDAEAHAARLTTDKRSTHFIQPVKEAIEEKKEEKKEKEK